MNPTHRIDRASMISTARAGRSLLVVLVLTVAACRPEPNIVAQSGVPITQPTREVSANDPVTVTARDIAFDVDVIRARPGAALTITFDNQDIGVIHNLHVAAGAVDTATDLTPGPDTNSLTVVINEVGTHRFFCDVHPVMTGELVIS